MRSYFLKLAHTFSTPIKPIQSRTIQAQTRSRFLVHDFVWNENQRQTSSSSLTITLDDTFFYLLPLFSFFFFFSLLFVLRTKRSMRSSATWKFKFPREEAESEWPPACTLCSKEIDFARACSRTSSGSWYSGTGWLEEVFTERNGANEIGDSL